MQRLAALLTLVLTLGAGLAQAQAQPLSEEEKRYVAWAQGIWTALDRRNGRIELPGGVAKLDVPTGFYYLGPADAETILVEVWGNVPGAGSDSLGMLFPKEGTPFDSDSWGVTIEYESDGHVSDDDADEIDYDSLLAQMKENTRDASTLRVQQGYEPIELIGWAARPYYDRNTHKLHWAKEVKFGQQEINTLNYNIRVLGREGVLVLNFIAGMDRKDVIEASVDDVLAMASFAEGHRYDDFDPSVDKMAAYGVGALVAGKVAAKTGLLAAAVLFFKKFGIFILAGVIAIGARIVRRRRG